MLCAIFGENKRNVREEEKRKEKIQNHLSIIHDVSCIHSVHIPLFVTTYVTHYDVCILENINNKHTDTQIILA